MENEEEEGKGRRGVEAGRSLGAVFVPSSLSRPDPCITLSSASDAAAQVHRGACWGAGQAGWRRGQAHCVRGEQ